jgi:hypothetical protein
MDEARKRHPPSLHDDGRLRTWLKRNCNFVDGCNNINKGYLEKISEEFGEGTVKTGTCLDAV